MLENVVRLADRPGAGKAGPGPETAVCIPYVFRTDPVRTNPVAVATGRLRKVQALRPDFSDLPGVQVRPVEGKRGSRLQVSGEGGFSLCRASLCARLRRA